MKYKALIIKTTYDAFPEICLISSNLLNTLREDQIKAIAEDCYQVEFVEPIEMETYASLSAWVERSVQFLEDK